MEKHKFGSDIEAAVSKKIVDEEYTTAKNSRKPEFADFQSIIRMLEGERDEKSYDWMSNVSLHELASELLTDASSWAAQYFTTRDFVEVRLDGFAQEDKIKSRAAKKCINQTLNRKDLYYYQKYIRGRLINALFGQVYAVCWWDQDVEKKQVGVVRRPMEMMNGETGEPDMGFEEVPKYEDMVHVDQFCFDIIDPRNVFTDGKYTYSIQEKDWVTIRFENSYEDLKKREKQNGYFNLDLVKELTSSQNKTETSKETYNQGEQDRESSKPVITKFDRLLRMGKFWAIVEERNSDGYPVKVKPGYKFDGELDEKAELIETIIETVVSGSTRILIRFQPNPFRDALGRSYKNIARGICYIHPTKDIGLADGKYLRDHEIAINDHFNMGSDRVKLATLPTMKGNKQALEDNTSVYFEPQHVIELYNPKEDLIEMEISDDIQGALQTIAMLKESAQNTTSIQRGTMGQLPENTSTPATAYAGAAVQSTVRGNYKSLTYEFTMLVEFYWIILQMTYQFAHQKTALKMMGDDAQYFDANADYTYSPVSTAIETEYNKFQKIKMLDQTMGRISGLVQVLPGIVPVIAHVLKMQLELYGNEYQDIANMIQKLAGSQPVMEQGQGAGTPTPNQVSDMSGNTSNQSGQPQSVLEQMTRGAMGGLLA